MQRSNDVRFSVLMSVYKGDNPIFLEKSILSVTECQTLKPMQLVLVKDGPVSIEMDQCIDALKPLLKSMDIDFVVVNKEINQGLAAALNTGFEFCTCNYIARMDSDDIAVADRFSKQHRYLSAHPEISILGGAIQEFETEEAVTTQFRIVPCEHDEIVEMMKTRNAMNHMTVVYKKEDITRVGGYSENFGKLEDYKLWVDAISAGLKLHNLPDVLVRARVGNGFIERRSSKREIQDWDMMQTYLKKAKMIGHSKAVLNKLYIRAFIYMPAWMKRIAYKTVLRK